ncbi:hypothetical protein [Pseudomonas oryzihabitans]|uniref:hypothetical protein n=1 Tax=Pseudomonas oryzihabitans TaxID=47885 RepID=UPI0011A7EC1A|nr:hypothetical protein [Pseudomonas oryzihabitans]
MTIPRETDPTIHVIKMTHDAAYREAHKDSEPRRNAEANVSPMGALCSEIRKSKTGQSCELDKVTTHLLKMKYDAEYAAAYKAGAVDVKKAAYHSTIEGDVNKDADPELQALASILATIELVKDPIQRLQLIKDWASR